jgi:hypothetical protein
MHRRQHNRLVARRASWHKRFVIAATVIGVASAGVWLIRDTTDLVYDYGPSEGSLIVNINTATQTQLESVPGIWACTGSAGHRGEAVRECRRIDEDLWHRERID